MLLISTLLSRHSICMPNPRTPEKRGFLPIPLRPQNAIAPETCQSHKFPRNNRERGPRGDVKDAPITRSRRWPRYCPGSAKTSGFRVAQKGNNVSIRYRIFIRSPSHALPLPLTTHPPPSPPSSLFASHPKIDPLKFELVPFFSLSPLIGWTFASGSFSAAKWPPCL